MFIIDVFSDENLLAIVLQTVYVDHVSDSAVGNERDVRLKKV